MKSVRTTDRNPALLRAISLSGSVAGLASALGITPSAVSQWKRVPVEHARKVSALTGIPLHELRDDVWAPEAA